MDLSEGFRNVFAYEMLSQFDPCKGLVLTNKYSDSPIPKLIGFAKNSLIFFGDITFYRSIFHHLETAIPGHVESNFIISTFGRDLTVIDDYLKSKYNLFNIGKVWICKEPIQFKGVNTNVIVRDNDTLLYTEDDEEKILKEEYTNQIYEIVKLISRFDLIELDSKNYVPLLNSAFTSGNAEVQIDPAIGEDQRIQNLLKYQKQGLFLHPFMGVDPFG